MRRSRHICRKLFERFPEIRNQLWKGELWNHSYYVETVGSVSEENIRRYIEHQSKGTDTMEERKCCCQRKHP